MTTAASSLALRRRLTLGNSAMLMAGTRVVIDLITLSLAVVVAFGTWSFINPLVAPHPPSMWLAVGLSFAALAFTRLYPGVGLTPVEHLRRICRSISFVYLLLTASMFLVKEWWASSRGGFLLSWGLSMILAPLGRWLSDAYFGSLPWWGIPVVILGAGKTGEAVIRNLRENPGLGYRPVVCLDDDPMKRGYCCGVPVSGELADAKYFAQLYGSGFAIVAIASLPRQQLLARLQVLSEVFQKVVVIPDLIGIATLWTEPRDMGGILGLEIRCNLLNPTSQMLKRAFDILASLIGLFISAPVFALAACWIKLRSPGAAFYSQEREGKNGKTIRIFKLRTMYPNAEQLLQQHLSNDAAAMDEWSRYCKLRRDPRVLPGLGAFLRQSSLDELPQLWNVLRGEMSLVGPRPFPKYHNQRFRPEFQTLRTLVTPGLTGLWQVGARSNGDLEVQTVLDTYYIRNWSPWLDLYVLVCTVRAVVAREGAY